MKIKVNSQEIKFIQKICEKSEEDILKIQRMLCREGSKACM